ncbi:MAG: hypothetical protein HYU58_19035 [Proteobacteria bacterium]|nr:hypothetical protein [Pseudomonadota bacterium]
MFGLPTFPKLLIIAAIIAAVWYFMRRGQVARREQESGREQSGSAAKPGARPQKPIEDMVQCKSCGAYFPAKSSCSCGHSGN